MARPKHTVLEYRNYELPADFPILVLTGERWHISPVPGKHLHIHNCLEIGLCHSSGGTMVFDRQRVHFTAGDVTCIARNVPHTTWSDPGEPSRWSYIFIDVEGLLGPSVLQQHNRLKDTGHFLSDCHLLLRSAEHPRILAHAEEIIAEMTEQAPGYHTCVRSLCTTLIIGLLRIYSQRSREDVSDAFMPLISPALDYIHENYMLDFPQSELSSLCHLSPTHFRRLFREQTGTSPLSFLHQTRILKSCSLLRSSALSVTEVAIRVGYNSQSSYNRHFARLMGMTPTAWRNASSSSLRPSLLTYSGWTEAEEPPEESPGSFSR